MTREILPPQSADEPDNVIQFKPLDPGAPILTRKRAESCGHERMECDEKNRNVKCLRCGAVLDPFDAMIRLAQRWERYNWTLLDIKGQIAEHGKRLEELKRVETNARARVRRLEKDEAREP